MLLLGLGLILLGTLAILAAVFVSDPGDGGSLLGFDVTTLSAFLVGVAAGAAVLLGISLLRWGTRRELAHRRERKELAQLQHKLEQVEARQGQGDEVTGSQVPPSDQSGSGDLPADRRPGGDSV